MKKIVLICSLFMPMLLMSQEWEPIGPDTLTVNNYFFDENTFSEYLCCDEGLLYSTETGTWELATYTQLPIIDAAPLNDTSILVLVGNGSWSDGVYQFDINQKELTILEWFGFPNFIHFLGAGYFVGAMEGLSTSLDGFNWDEFYYIDNVIDIITEGQQWLVFVCENGAYIHSTPDAGATWYWGEQFSELPLTDAAYNQGTVYLSISGNAISSGLYSSDDFGDSFSKMASVPGIEKVFCAYDLIFASWHESFDDYEGVAIWDSASLSFEFINDGLPNLQINNISNNPFVDCENIIACTDQGAYMRCGPFSSTPKALKKDPIEIDLYPNPFSKSINLTTSNNIDYPLAFELFDVTGKKMFSGIMKESKDSQDITKILETLEGGIYLIKFNSDNILIAKKIIKK